MILGDLYETLAVRVLARHQHASVPVRVREAAKQGHFVARVKLPGCEKSGIRVRVHGQTVKVDAIRRSSRGEEDARGGRHGSEPAERVSRMFELPRAVDAERAEARYRAGVLTLRLPMPPAPGERLIAVH